MRLFRTVSRAMASEHELLLWSDDEARAARAADAAVADVLRIEAKYSRYRADSVTTEINRAAGGEAVAIDAETAALLAYADRCHRLSGGRFDVTSGVLRCAWNFRRAPPQLPDAATLAAVTALIGWNRVEWNERSIRLPAAGMELDFGGVGKEYAADRAATVCLEHGIDHGLVNLGGDERRLRALFRNRGTVLLPYPRPADGAPRLALAVGQRRRTALRCRRKLRHDCDAARTGGRRISAPAGIALRHRGCPG